MHQDLTRLAPQGDVSSHVEEHLWLGFDQLALFLAR
jgi:hypothetical protein